MVFQDVKEGQTVYSEYLSCVFHIPESKFHLKHRCVQNSVCLFHFPLACGRGFYKSSSQDLQCSRCPMHSFSDREGSSRCDCEDSYYRAPTDPPYVACTSELFMDVIAEGSFLANHRHRHLQDTCALPLFLWYTENLNTGVCK